MHYGDTKIGEVYSGATKIGEGWVWEGGVWRQVYSAVQPPIVLSRSRMDAYPNVVSFPRGTWVDVPVDTHDYGDPIVGGRVVSSGGGEALVFASVGWIWEEDSDPPFTIAVTVNGVRVAELEADMGVDATVTLRKGDAVGAQIYSTAPAAACLYDSANIGIWSAGFMF